MLKSRRSSLEPFFEEYDLDAILISDLRNIRYLCGFSGSEGALLVSPATTWFLCDSRYTAQAETEVQGAVVKECALRLETLYTLATENGLKRIGFEATHTSVSAYRKIAGVLKDIELVELGSVLDNVRTRKDSSIQPPEFPVQTG